MASMCPGMTGTPAFLASSLLVILSPITSTASTGGPMKTMPAASTALANSAFSERKP